VNKLKVRPIINASNVEKSLESLAPNITADCSKTVVEIDCLVDDIITSKEARTDMFVENILNHEKEILFVSVEAVPIYVQDTSSSCGMASPIVGDVMNLANEVFCEELQEEEKVVADSIPLGNQDMSILVQDSNLSNFSTNVMHDMQVLGFLSVPTAAKQTMDFLNNNYWANMAQTEEMVDSVGSTNQQFQLVVPKKRRTSSNKNKLRLVKGSR
jgi:hypothetical protein